MNALTYTIDRRVRFSYGRMNCSFTRQMLATNQEAAHTARTLAFALGVDLPHAEFVVALARKALSNPNRR